LKKNQAKQPKRLGANNKLRKKKVGGESLNFGNSMPFLKQVGGTILPFENIMLLTVKGYLRVGRLNCWPQTMLEHLNAIME